MTSRFVDVASQVTTYANMNRWGGAEMGVVRGVGIRGVGVKEVGVKEVGVREVGVRVGDWGQGDAALQVKNLPRRGRGRLGY